MTAMEPIETFTVVKGCRIAGVSYAPGDVVDASPGDVGRLVEKGVLVAPEHVEAISVPDHDDEANEWDHPDTQTRTN